MKKQLFVLFLLLIPADWMLPPPSCATRTSAAMRSVAVICVDGMRPDLLLRARAPNMRRLMEDGSFTFWAQTTEMAVTLPSCVSMLTGVPPEKHKITFNTDPPAGGNVYPAYPTIFELAKKAGCTTALTAGKSKLSVLARPGTVDWQSLPARGEEADDAGVAEAAAAIVARHRPRLLFVHFADTDKMGHEYGWGSSEQVAGTERTDAAVGVVLAAIDHAGLMGSTMILLTADHGGAGRDHGSGDPRSRTIPWIVAGPGVARGVDLTLHRGLTVSIEDTFATACHYMGIKTGTADGKPVRQIWSK